MEEEEYELVPLNPLRKMEKRLNRLERAGTSTEMIKELIEVVRTNQKIVDDIVKINSEMINRVTEMTGSVSQLSSKIEDFMGRLEVVNEGGAEDEPSGSKELEDRLKKLEKRVNAVLLSSLAKKKMQKRAIPRPR